MPIHHRQPKERIAHAGGATTRPTRMGYLRFLPAGTTTALPVKLADAPPATSSGHRLRRIAAPALLALLICSCAAITLAQGKAHAVNLDQAPAQPLRLVRTIDAGGEPLFSGRFTTLTADPESNKIYVGDQDQIFVLAAGGTIDTTFGRRGQGPGEFIDIAAIASNHSHLFVADRQLSRIQTFARSDHAYARTIPLHSVPHAISATAHALYVAAPSAQQRLLRRYRLDSPLQPAGEAIAPLQRFAGLTANPLSLNQVLLAAHAGTVFALYRGLPLLVTLDDSLQEQRTISFTGDRVASFLAGSSPTISGAMYVFASRILVDASNTIWMLTYAERKFPTIYGLDADFVPLVMLQPESDPRARSRIEDFAVLGNAFYLLDNGNGVMGVYRPYLE